MPENDGIGAIVEVIPSTVHFVEESHTWYVVFIGLPPDGLGMVLNHFNYAKKVTTISRACR